jgi:hypothetical protein
MRVHHPINNTTTTSNNDQQQQYHPIIIINNNNKRQLNYNNFNSSCQPTRLQFSLVLLLIISILFLVTMRKLECTSLISCGDDDDNNSNDSIQQNIGLDELKRQSTYNNPNPNNNNPTNNPTTTTNKNDWKDNPYLKFIPKPRKPFGSPIIPGIHTQIKVENLPPSCIKKNDQQRPEWQICDPDPSIVCSVEKVNKTVQLNYPRLLKLKQTNNKIKNNNKQDNSIHTVDFLQNILREAWGRSDSHHPRIDLYVRAGCDGADELKYLFESIALFWPTFLGDILVVLDYGNDLVLDHLLPTTTTTQHSFKIIYERCPCMKPRIFNQYSYLTLDHYTNAEYAVTLDSDCVLHSPVTPDVLFNNKQQIIMPTAIEYYQGYNFNEMQSVLTLRDFAPIGHSMCSQPVSVVVDSLREFREWIKQVNGGKDCYELRVSKNIQTFTDGDFCWMCQLNVFLYAVNYSLVDLHFLDTRLDPYYRYGSHVTYELFNWHYYSIEKSPQTGGVLYDSAVQDLILGGLCRWFGPDYFEYCEQTDLDKVKFLMKYHRHVSNTYADNWINVALNSSVVGKYFLQLRERLHVVVDRVLKIKYGIENNSKRSKNSLEWLLLNHNKNVDFNHVKPVSNLVNNDNGGSVTVDNGNQQHVQLPSFNPTNEWGGYFLERDLSDPTKCVSALTPRGDGFGAQIAMELTCLAVSFHAKLPPCIPKWDTMEHVTKEMQLKLSEMIPFSRRSDCETCRFFPGERELGGTWNHPLVFAHHFYTPEVLVGIRRFYQIPLSRQGLLPLGHLPDRTNVAVHIRIMNANDGGFSVQPRIAVVRAAMVEMVEKTLPGNDAGYKPAYFIVYSQESRDGWRIFNELLKDSPLNVSTKFVLDSPVDETFDGMVRSDVLIMAESALSLSAAIFHKGWFVYYMDSWTGPLRHWKCMESNCELWDVPKEQCEELSCKLAFGGKQQTQQPSSSSSLKGR